MLQNVGHNKQMCEQYIAMLSSVNGSDNDKECANMLVKKDYEMLMCRIYSFRIASIF